MNENIGEIKLYATKIDCINDFPNILDIDTKSVKCFLCNESFTNGDESFLLFNERIHTDGSAECPLAKILSKILNIEIKESTAHSLLLCTTCNEIVLAFEQLEQQLLELRTRIVNSYESTTKMLTENKTKVNLFKNDIRQHDEHDNLVEEEWAIDEDEISLDAIKNVDIMVDTANNEIIENNNLIVDEMELQDINGQDIIIFNGALDENDLDTQNEQNELVEQSTTNENSATGSDFIISNDSVEAQDLHDFEAEENLEQFQIIKVKNETLNEQIFACDLCDETTFQTEDELNEHFAEVHIKDWSTSLLHECEICKVCFENYKDLEKHLTTHKEREKNYICEQCQKCFATKYSLQTHMKIHGERSRSYECNECGKSFLTQQNLQHHKKIHNNQRQYKCQICQKGFTTQHNLDAHGIVHSEKRPYSCGICGKSFARRAEVTDHERIHTGLKPFKCDLCDAAFAQRSNLTAHKKTTHLNEKLHKCDICERSFKRRRLLVYHKQAAHTGERPYKCKICSSSFVYPEHYKKHQRIHTGDKPFSCEVCGKSFNSRDNRNAHRFVHSDKKPYECMQCGVGFMRKPLLLAHMKHSKHVNDTIIVNQPQINGGILQTTTVTLNSTDHFDVVEQREEFIIPDSSGDLQKGIDFKIESNEEKIETEVAEHVKYIQFDDFEVDIADDEN